VKAFLYVVGVDPGDVIAKASLVFAVAEQNLLDFNR
jgi:hypothetical protein